MMKTLKINLLLLMITSLIFACDDFIEKELKNENVVLLAPANNLTTIQLTHTFWWDWIDGAETYNMQVVEGSFNSVTKFLLDTNITNNKFEYTLYPGSFQWRVKGLNNGSETNFTTFSFSIDSSLNISTQQIILSSPADNYITNSMNLTFIWNSLLNANDYLLEIHENTWTGILAFGPQVTSNTTLSTSLSEGTFVWGVQGRNSTSNSSTSFTTRTLTVDTTSPNIVTLVSPADNVILSDIYNTYTWTQGANTGTALIDNISFYSDAGANNLLKSIQAVGTSQQDSLGVGIYYWRVQSTDAAGNIGPNSLIRKVTIQ